MGNSRDFVIPFLGLKLGTHDFEFIVEDSFFEKFEYAIVDRGNVHVNLQLERKETMLIAHFSLRGEVFTNCDRCNTETRVPLQGDYELIYKFGTEPSDDENLMVLHPDEYQIDLQEPIYEFISISLPNRVVHPEGLCDEEMVEALQAYLVNPDEEDFDNDEDEDFDDSEDDSSDDDDIDPRWSALKNLN